MNINNYPTIQNESGCFIWQGTKNSAGYGLIYFNKSQILVHRFLYQLLNPNTNITHKIILHTCDNLSCINPEHLKLGTQQDNIQDCSNKNRWGKYRHSKLTEDQAKEIKYSLLPNRIFIEKYKISKQLVSAIRKNLVWKDI